MSDVRRPPVGCEVTALSCKNCDMSAHVQVRLLLISTFRPLFRLSRQDLSMKEIVFATVAGLRGSVSLILAQAVVVDPSFKPHDPGDVETIVSLFAQEHGTHAILNPILNQPLSFMREKHFAARPFMSIGWLRWSVLQ